MATVSAGTPYQELIQAIADYYGSGSDQWLQVAQYGTTADDFIEIVNQLPNYQVVTNKAGDIISYQKIDALPSVNSASVIDSNVVNAPVKVSTPATVTTSQGEVVASKGITTTSGTQFITKSVLPAIAAAGVGITLGKTIDSVLYNANPDFWDSNGMGALNPETWASITTDMSGSTGEQALATAFNLLFGIDPNTNESQAYIDQNALAYLTAYMSNRGMLDKSEYTTTVPEPIRQQLPAPIPATFPIDENESTAIFGLNASLTSLVTYHEYVTEHTAPVYVTRFLYTPLPDSSPLQVNGYHWILASTEPFSGYSDYGTAHNALNVQLVRVLDENIYVAFSSITQRMYAVDVPTYASYAYSGSMPGSWVNSIAYAMTYGDREKTEAMAGVNDQINASVYYPSGISDYSDISATLTALQTKYPDLFNNAVTYPVLQPDGTTTDYTYIPIALPDVTSATDTQPTASGQDITQTTPAYDPTTMPTNVWENLWKILQPTPTEIDTPTDTTGEGNTPAIVPPAGSASALWRIYNPSQGQLDSFGAWLWSSNFVDQLLKVFNDPMQAIIGLHKIFVSPPVSGSGAIKVGYLVSDASANYVSGQYVDVDCGSVTLEEYFNNVFDYESTEVSIYLPFSGIHRLNTSDVMRGNINVKYHVDVLTGACLIDISVTRDAAGGVLYTFSGNCAVQYPVSSGSYVGIVTGLLGIAGGITGTIASGGMLAPLLMGAGASIGNMHTNVSHSGNISSNAGAMGAKIPYLIIERPQTKTPPTAVTIEGLPQNDIVTLSTLTGFTRVKKARYDGLSCTSDELNIIRGLLESGVYIN